MREGDRIRISRGQGRHQDVIVRIAIDQHVKKSEARVLYDDVTPKPTPEGDRDAPHGAGLPGGRTRGRHTRPPGPPAAATTERRILNATLAYDEACRAIRKSSASGKCCTRSSPRGTAPRLRRWPTELDVTTRTIRRDLAALQEAGFPLFDERDDGAAYGGVWTGRS